MVLSHTHRLIFIHNFKAAGSSIEWALWPYTPRFTRVKHALEAMGVPIPHGWGWARLIPGHVRAKELKALLPADVWESCFKFAFVRNPWDWLVSRYEGVLRDPRQTHHKKVHALKSFEAYVEWTVRHDRPLQKEFVADENGEVIVDFIGRYESLHDDFALVCDRLGLTAELPHLNRSPHAAYEKYYTPHTRQLVGEHYREDIEFFGYSFIDT